MTVWTETDAPDGLDLDLLEEAFDRGSRIHLPDGRVYVVLRLFAHKSAGVDTWTAQVLRVLDEN